MSKIKTIFICSNCGWESLKWLGKCPECGAWSSFVEEVQETAKKRAEDKNVNKYKIYKLSEIEWSTTNRIATNIEEFDRVLGGGFMPGSVVLLGGEPGIGKSTLALQALTQLNGKSLYISGEESPSQIKLRALRTEADEKNFLIVPETELDKVIAAIRNEKPSVAVVDSIQTIYDNQMENSPGSITQIKHCAAKLMKLAKDEGIAILLIGHVTKDGEIAGPKVLEHIVDAVIQFEGEKNYAFRILRAKKNRFGAVNEIGVFEMSEKGLREVKNPSDAFMSDNNEKTSGSIIAAALEGARPFLVEIQALATPSYYSAPQRICSGFDYRRFSILTAALEKRANLKLSNYNLYLNVAGGLKIEEPAVDLAVCLSVTSSYYDIPPKEKVAVIGEVGLNGEIRGAFKLEERINEAKKLGFAKIIIPKLSRFIRQKNYSDLQLYEVANLTEAIKVCFGVNNS